MNTSDEKEYEHAAIAACSAFLLTYLKSSDMIHISVRGRCPIKPQEFCQIGRCKGNRGHPCGRG